MDGRNRRFQVATTLLAIPAIMMMTVLSAATPPSEVVQAKGDVVQAKGDVDDQQQKIQQVVGKQPQTRKTRPIGLFNSFKSNSDSSSKSNSSSKSKQAPTKSKSRGLLDGLFNQSRPTASNHNHAKSSSNSKTSSRTHSSTAHNSSPHSPQPTANRGGTNRDGADWDGIPFHEVSGSSRTGSRTPIQDPNRRTASSSGSTQPLAEAPKTRIIRGGAARPAPARTTSVPAKTASVRKQPTLAVEPVPALAVPKPLPDNERFRTSGSSSSSSRRSGRRSVASLDASEIAAAQGGSTDDADDLVPKVARRTIEPAAESKPKVAAKPVPKVSPKPEPALAPAPAVVAPKAVVAPNTVAAPKAEAPEAVAAPTTKSVPNESSSRRESSTALANITPPSESEPNSAADLAPKAGLSAPKVSPQYTEPGQAEPRPIPVAGIPSHPYAASTPTVPSRPVAHRIGPPNAAFAPTQVEGTVPSAPVGSGVVAGNASYRRPSGTPSYPVRDHSPAAEPTGSVTYPYQTSPYQAATPRLNTNGQASVPAERIAERPTYQGSTVPMKPIAGLNPSTPIPAETQDGFASTNFDAQNRMRGNLGAATPGVTAVASELPGIRVITNGPGAIMIRQTTQYEIRVENRGSIDAQGVMIRALVPDWADLTGQNATRGDIDKQKTGSAERLVWTIDQLPAGATERMFVRLKAGRSGTYDLDVDWTLVPQKSVAKVQVREPKLGLSIDGPDNVVFGQSQTYKVRVLNPGDGTAPNVVFTLSPNSATPQTQRIGDIPAGKEAQFEVELTAQDLGDLKIHGLASGDLELRAEASKTIRVASAKLVAMLTGPQLKYQNTESMYNIELQNAGTAASHQITASLKLPPGVKYLGGIEGANLRGQTLTWGINSLAPDATRNYQFRCNMATTGEHVFSFDCKGSAAGAADVAIATRVESIADLVLTISDPVAPAPIGTDVTYEIVVRNRGSKEATEVRAVAQFSNGIEPQRIEGQSGEVVTGQVLFDPIPRIGPGQEVKMRVIAKAESAGHHRFRTEIRSGDTVLVAEEATHYMSPTSDRVSRRSTDNKQR